ncbi:DedA family protein [Candidatus Uhrbacteria bacterium]|nr:DedA family protein [Candidatus Uhrbacteria bacterium]
MLGFLTSLLESLVSNPPLVYGFLFLDAALTTVPVIGVIVLETPVAVLAGALAAQGYISFWQAALWATLGGIVGDAMGYYIGTWSGMRLMRYRWAPRHKQFETARAFFDRHGGKGIILARFIGPLRTVIPLVVGVLGMPKKIFWFYNVASAVLWAAVFYPLGYFFGSQWQPIVAWAERAGWALLVVCMVLVAWYWKKSTSRNMRKNL